VSLYPVLISQKTIPSLIYLSDFSNLLHYTEVSSSLAFRDNGNKIHTHLVSTSLSPYLLSVVLQSNLDSLLQQSLYLKREIHTYKYLIPLTTQPVLELRHSLNSIPEENPPPRTEKSKDIFNHFHQQIYYPQEHQTPSLLPSALHFQQTLTA
jgi:hypothetical protein